MLFLALMMNLATGNLLVSKQKKNVVVALQKNSEELIQKRQQRHGGRLYYLVLILIAGSFAASMAKAEEAELEFRLVSPNSPENSPFEALRLRLFAKNQDTPGCLLVNRGIGPAAEGIDQGLQNLIDQLIAGMQSMRPRSIVGLFHPRLNVTSDTLESIFARHRRTYGGRRMEVSVYRLWALNSVDGQPGMFSCNEDQALVRAQFGYPLQFGLWLQVRGTNELGRVFLSIVAVEGQWKIGVWHNQQWTHSGKDPETWLDDAIALRDQGNVRAAYVKLDIAYKLLDSAIYIDSQLRRDVKATRDALFTEEAWTKQLAEIVTDFRVVDAGTILAEDGAGVVIRKITDPMDSAIKKRQNCLDAVRKIYQQPWASTLGGAKCSMVTEHEPYDRDGVLGSVYFNRSEILNPSYKP